MSLQETECALGRPPSATDDYALLLKRVINSMDRKIEFGGQMAAAAILGHPACHMSHKFVVISPWQLVKSLPSLFPETADEIFEEQGAAPDGSVLQEAFLQAEQLLDNEAPKEEESQHIFL